MGKLRTLSVLFSLILLGSCTYDSEDDLVSTEIIGEDDPNQELDADAITYDNTIRAIVDSNCISCHSSPPRNGAPFGLVNFSQVSSRANGIFNAISRQAGAAGAMPPAGRLPQNTINQFDEWIENDTPED